MGDDGSEKSDLRLPDGEVGTNIQKAFEADQTVVAAPPPLMWGASGGKGGFHEVMRGWSWWWWRCLGGGVGGSARSVAPETSVPVWTGFRSEQAGDLHLLPSVSSLGPLIPWGGGARVR